MKPIQLMMIGGSKFNRIFVSLLVIFYLSNSHANSNDAFEIEVNSVEVIKTDYLQSKIAIEYDIDIKAHRSFVLLGYVLDNDGRPQITRTMHPTHLSPGSRMTTLDVPRSYLFPYANTTTKLRISLHDRARIDVRNAEWKKDVDINIEWPGFDLHRAPDETLAKKNGKLNAERFDSIQRLRLNSTIPDASQIYVNLIELGFPRDKMRWTGFSYYEGSTGGFYFGTEVEVEDAHFLMNKFAEYGAPVLTATIINRNVGSPNNDEVRYRYPLEKNEPEIYNEVAPDAFLNPELTQDEWYALFDYVPITDEKRVALLHLEIVELIEHGSEDALAGAKSRIDEALNIIPQSPKVLHELARWYMRTDPRMYGHVNTPGVLKAERVLESALDIDPNDADLHVLMGYVNVLQDDYEDAETHLQRAKDLETDNFWLYYNWGLLKKRTNKESEALEKYAIATEMPRPPEPKNQRAHKFSFNSYISLALRLSQPDGIDDVFERRLTQYPEDTCVAVDQAKFRTVWLDKYDEAQGALTRANIENCKEVDEARALAYFAKWGELVNLGDKSGDAKKIRLLADTHGPDTTQLIFKLAEGPKESVTLKRIIDAGVDIDTTNFDGLTALGLAVTSSNLRAVQSLLSMGADPNQLMTGEGWTPLIIAASTGSREIVESLLANNADPKLTLTGGQSAAYVAKVSGFTEIAELLDQKGGI